MSARRLPPRPANFVTAGYEFEDESYLNRSLGVTASANSTVEVSERSHAFFVQDQLRFLDERLQLSVAFRAQTFSLGSPRFSPAGATPYSDLDFVSPPTAYTGDGSVAYLFRSTNTKLRAQVGNGYRKPSLFERFGTFFDSSFGFSALGDLLLHAPPAGRGLRRHAERPLRTLRRLPQHGRRPRARA